MKNSIFKRIMALILVLCLAMSAFLVSCNKDKGDDDDKDGGSGGNSDIINSIGGVSETFTGVMSTQSYDTAEDAAEAFVLEEMATNDDVVIEDVKSTTLSNDEISKVGIPSEFLDGADSVEKVEVSYLVTRNETMAMSSNDTQTTGKDTLNKEKKVVVYVIKYGTDWKYFAPLPETDATLSKSYYDSVFDPENFVNCTMKYDNDITISATAQGENMEIVMSVSQLIKHADGKVYLEQSMDVTYNIPGEDETSNEQVMYAYLEEVNGQIRCYIKQGKNSTEWVEGSLNAIGFDSLDDLTPFRDQYLDNSYFTKTDYGFVLAQENAKLYFKQALAQSLAQAGMGSMINMDDVEVDMYAEYYVSNGILSAMDVNADVDINMTTSGVSVTMNEKVIGKATCTDYGTTVVEKPFEE